jgi:hypothetical protein
MNLTNPLKAILLFLIFFIPERTYSEKYSKSNHQKTEWVLSELISAKTEGIHITGNPQVIDCKYGKALVFNGSTDGIFIDRMPLKGLKNFTIEVILRPESNGNFEQRFFHCGEISGNRVLLELRSTKTDWYFDAFINSGDQKKTLIEPTFTHPLDQWYHVAFVVSNGKQRTYINGMKELESQIKTVPLQRGKTSIGVRQNEQSWFKGAIYKIRISPETLDPVNFMNF